MSLKRTKPPKRNSAAASRAHRSIKLDKEGRKAVTELRTANGDENGATDEQVGFELADAKELSAFAKGVEEGARWFRD
ncbi:hypothetical protein Tdes44962_MAKER07946 [Teratosphaeria destructans]|uniref:Uncharacterized protein n=1 Tax=Teratosphaeria destructans TaxID=418781 RepID=A0A9W7SYC3_9PEZI|nr:hypothetical protein Tdes44962_MAKER07946 [Teratosphaeria destructans]